MRGTDTDARGRGGQGKRGVRPAGSIRLGSEEHLRLFCLELLEAHDPYKPAVIDWPVLDPDALNRLTSLVAPPLVRAQGAGGVGVDHPGAPRRGRRVGSQESNGDKNFAMTGSHHVDIDLDLKAVVAICLEENDRRLAPYDRRLIRPRFVPMVARLVLKLLG